MIDWIRVAQLRDEIGADDFDEVADLFLLEVEETLDQLDSAQGDVVRMEEILHFLKGSALNLGFAEFSAPCATGEADASCGTLSVDPTQIKALYAKSKRVFEAEYVRRFVA